MKLCFCTRWTEVNVLMVWVWSGCEDECSLDYKDQRLLQAAVCLTDALWWHLRVHRKNAQSGNAVRPLSCKKLESESWSLAFSAHLPFTLLQGHWREWGGWDHPCITSSMISQCCCMVWLCFCSCGDAKESFSNHSSFYRFPVIAVLFCDCTCR